MQRRAGPVITLARVCPDDQMCGPPTLTVVLCLLSVIGFCTVVSGMVLLLIVTHQYCTSQLATRRARTWAKEIQEGCRGAQAKSAEEESL